jgi:hypothetical protein
MTCQDARPVVISGPACRGDDERDGLAFIEIRNRVLCSCVTGYRNDGKRNGKNSHDGGQAMLVRIDASHGFETSLPALCRKDSGRRVELIEMLLLAAAMQSWTE